MSQRKKLLHVGMRKKFFLMHLIMWLFENKETRDVPNLRSEYYTIEMWRL